MILLVGLFFSFFLNLTHSKSFWCYFTMPTINIEKKKIPIIAFFRPITMAWSYTLISLSCFPCVCTYVCVCLRECV